MRYTDADGNEIRVYESTVKRLKYIAAHAPVGRLQAPGPWKPQEVRALQTNGFCEVEWLERGDTDHRGAWDILGLTDQGRDVIRLWDERQAKKTTTQGET